uniref:Uncharacterized protein n=2 Tax=Rhizophagus irregularis TaxID=588596 RepID=U9TAI2_RHIID
MNAHRPVVFPAPGPATNTSSSFAKLLIKISWSLSGTNFCLFLWEGIQSAASSAQKNSMHDLLLSWEQNTQLHTNYNITILEKVSTNFKAIVNDIHAVKSIDATNENLVVEYLKRCDQNILQMYDDINVIVSQLYSHTNPHVLEERRNSIKTVYRRKSICTGTQSNGQNPEYDQSNYSEGVYSSSGHWLIMNIDDSETTFIENFIDRKIQDKEIYVYKDDERNIRRRNKIVLLHGRLLMVTEDGIPCFSPGDFKKVATNNVVLRYSTEEFPVNDYGASRINENMNRFVNTTMPSEFDSHLCVRMRFVTEIRLVFPGDCVTSTTVSGISTAKIVDNDGTRMLISNNYYPCTTFGEFGELAQKGYFRN